MISKAYIFLLALTFYGIVSNAQVLIKNNQGEEVFSSNQNLQGILLNLNTGATSLGVDYFFNNKADDPSRYNIFRLGISGKATDGISSLVKAGEFSPGVALSASMMKIGIFAPKIINHKFSDWIEFKINYGVDKYKLFNADTSYKEQVSSKRFDAYNFGASYNVVLGPDQDYLSIGINFAKKSNYQELTSVEVHDYSTVADPTGKIERRYGSTQTAKKGTFKMYEAYPLTIAYTHLPKYQHQNQKEVNSDGERVDKKIDKSTTVVQIVTSKPKIDTLVRTSIDKDGKIVKTTEIIERKESKENLSTVTTEKVAVPNPFFKSLKLGYTIYLNSDFQNTAGPTLSKLGTTLFLVSPNKDNITTSRIGLTTEITDLFDSKKANNGPLKRINIGFTVNFSI